MRALLTHPIRSMTSVAVLVLTLSSTGAVRADDLAVYHKTLRSTGWIYVPGRGEGTCWIVDRDERLVITNVHVVRDSDYAEVMFPKYEGGKLVTAAKAYLQVWPSQAIKGKVLYRDVKRDLALVQLESLPAGLQTLSLAAKSARNGDQVLSVGNSGLSQKPMDQAEVWTLRTGTVLGKAFRAFTLAKTDLQVESSMLNSTVNSRPGDSGGPVVNVKGELVAVTSSGNDIDSFAIDVTEVRAFIHKATQVRRLPPDPTTLAGSWSISWVNSAGVRFTAGLTLRADGTCMWEEMQAYEGTYQFAKGRLTLDLPTMQFKITVAIDYDGGDRVQFTGERINYTMERR